MTYHLVLARIVPFTWEVGHTDYTGRAQNKESIKLVRSMESDGSQHCVIRL
jgi:hypothetical protein